MYSVKTPTTVLLKAGADSAVLDRIEDQGRRLIFKEGAVYGPKKFMVVPGESLCIRDTSFRMLGNVFSETELQKIEKVRACGFTHFFLSYVESQRDIDQFLGIVGCNANVQLKIETRAGLEFVAREFKKTPHCSLMAACGDLYVEIEKPHEIMAALKLIIEKDPDACAGSRLLLSVGQPLASDVKKTIESLEKDIRPDKSETDAMLKNLTEPQIPSCADFLQLAWLSDMGYHRMMLCDEICVKENLLSTAVNAFDAFRRAYIT